MPVILCFSGFLLANQNAIAGAWKAVTVESALAASSSSAVEGNALFFYLIDPFSGITYEGRTVNGNWQFIPVSKGATSTSPGALGFYRLLVHSDEDNTLRLSVHNPFSGSWSAQVVDSGFDSVSGEVASVVLGNKLYMFYEAKQLIGNGKSLLFCASWDGLQFTHQVLDGSGGAQGRVTANMSEPAAVKTPDGQGIRVYYRDDDDATLREAFSPDGVNWTSFVNVDGANGVGPNWGDVGHHPSAVVFNSTVNVFYGDQTNSVLRTAQLSNGIWSFGLVDTWDGSWNASLIHNGAMQVYYVSNHQLRSAWGTGPYTFNWIPLDGKGGVANGALPDQALVDHITAVEFNQAPTVFYGMTNGLAFYVRNSFWQP